MIAGQIVCIVGSGLVTRIALNTSTAIWASFLVITGTGMGMAQQIPYTAVQAVLRYFAFTPGERLGFYSADISIAKMTSQLVTASIFPALSSAANK